MGSGDEHATHPAMQHADEAVARIAAMTPEEIADYIQGAVQEDDSGIDQSQEAVAADTPKQRRPT